jgi:type IV secretory pathway protease TraF
MKTLSVIGARTKPDVRRKLASLTLIALTLGLAAAATQTSGRQLVVYNDSASVPIGFWTRSHFSSSKIKRGTVIGFRPPALAREYVRAFMPEYIRQQLIEKYVAGVPGDMMCRTGATFSIDGRILGRAATKDGEGHLLPVWQGCQVLGAGEYAVFSNRIANSYDSRYYGAVPSRDIRGIYHPLWTW